MIWSSVLAQYAVFSTLIYLQHIAQPVESSGSINIVFVDPSRLFLLQNGPRIEKSLLLIDLFMTSEGSDTLNLSITSKTGQSVAQNRQKICLFGFY